MQCDMFPLHGLKMQCDMFLIKLLVTQAYTWVFL